jgi:hypothetical protein
MLTPRLMVFNDTLSVYGTYQEHFGMAVGFWPLVVPAHAGTHSHKLMLS